MAITDQEGEIREKRHFDPWGNIVHLQDGENNDLDVLTILDRGYTGHEHLQRVELIHMNGRLYDPLLHRFLAPDNFIQNHLNTQNFNRYAYVLNNPLLYTDPSGEKITWANFFKSVVKIMASVIVTVGAVAVVVGVASILMLNPLTTVLVLPLVAAGALIATIHLYNEIDSSVDKIWEQNEWSQDYKFERRDIPINFDLTIHKNPYNEIMYKN